MNSKLKIGAIVLARCDSTRLPRKVLRKLNGKPLIWYCLERIKKVKEIDSIIITTSDRKNDDRLANYAYQEGLSIFRGSKENVSERFLECSKHFMLDYAIRVNVDCPFIDIKLLNTGISLIKKNYDLITNVYPRTFPFGIILEIVKVKKYQEIFPNFFSADHFEHVTKYMYENIEEFNFYNLTNSDNSKNFLKYRLTVDNIKHLKNFRKFLKNYPKQWTKNDFYDAIRFGGFEI